MSFCMSQRLKRIFLEPQKKQTLIELLHFWSLARSPFSGRQSRIVSSSTLAASKWIALVRSRMLSFSLVILLLRVAIMETLQRTRTEVGFLGSSFSIACITLEDGTDYEPFYVVSEHVNKASLGSVSSKPDSHRTHMVSWRSHQGLMTVSWDSANLSDWETLALYHSTGVM